MTTTLHWFRGNLRLMDNRALNAAAQGADRVICVFVLGDPAGEPSRGVASRAWLAHSLEALAASLRESGSTLVVRAGNPGEELAVLATQGGASHVHCQRDWSPRGLRTETEVAATLQGRGITLMVSEGQLLATPDALATASGTPYRVFTPYWRAWRRAWDEQSPLEPPSLGSPGAIPAGNSALSPQIGGPDIANWWTAGEAAALDRCANFTAGVALSRYPTDHDFPGIDGTSALSIRLAAGEIAPSHVARTALDAGGESAESFVRQLAWRDFSYHVVHHFPGTLTAPLRPEFGAFPWQDDDAGFDAWSQGQTGYPLVDAGMRQMLATGWMHNRVRMVCASFLTKHLLVPWQRGERFFAERLADYDQAVNVFNWQWVAGCGADAAPYFRIFNPSLQSRKFDSEGIYLRTWVPELAALPAPWIHQPWDAPGEQLSRAGVRIGATYPAPIIDHAQARLRALAAYESVKDAARR